MNLNPATSKDPSSLEHLPTVPVAQSEFYSPKKFARKCDISESTARRLVKVGKIPAIQPGGKRTRILIPRDALSLVASTAEPPVKGDGGEPNQSSHKRGPTPKWRRK
jgi:hypothetical protein